MGATVTTGKLAAALVSGRGTIIYVLFEESYEKNCHPHTPDWCCIAIGEYADVMHRVFGSASSCQGGMLQSRQGNIKPENYIEDWRRKLANPVRMNDVSIRLRVGDQFDSPVLQRHLEQVKIACHKTNRADLYEDIESGTATVSLYEDIELILAIYGYNKGFTQPWRVLSYGSASSTLEPGLAPQPTYGALLPLDAAVYRIDQNYLLRRYGDLPWGNCDWAYAVIGDFIRSIAYAREMQCSGSSKKLIAEFRNLCDAAKDLPPDTVITVTRKTEDSKEWHLESADKLAEQLGLSNQSDKYVFTFDKADSPDAVRSLCYLHDSQVEWKVLPTPGYVSADSRQTGSETLQPMLL